MIREISGPAIEDCAPTEVAAGNDAVEDKKDANKPGRPAGPMFDGEVINEEGMQVPVVVGEVPRGQIADRHDEDDGDHEGNEQPAEAVAKKDQRTFPGQRGEDKDAADQEHQGHEKDVIEIFEDVEAEGTSSVDDRVSGSDICLGVKLREGGIGKRRMMGDDEDRNKSTKVVEPVGAV